MRAVSGVGDGTTGGTRITAPWRPGMGKPSPANLMCLAKAGSAQRKMSTEA